MYLPVNYIIVGNMQYGSVKNKLDLDCSIDTFLFCKDVSELKFMLIQSSVAI